MGDPLEMDLHGLDAIIVSPGVPLNRHPIAARAREAGVPIIGDIELFAHGPADTAAAQGGRHHRHQRQVDHHAR